MENPQWCMLDCWQRDPKDFDPLHFLIWRVTVSNMLNMVPLNGKQGAKTCYNGSCCDSFFG